MRLEDLFSPGDVNILLINQPVVSEKDVWVWRFNQSGAYSVRSGYEIAFLGFHHEQLSTNTVRPSLNHLQKKVWSLLAPSKIKVFIWKEISNALSVFDNLKSRGIKCDLFCQTCGREGESINHVLFSCTLARQVWALSGFPSPRGGFNEESVFENMNYLILRWSDDRN